MDCNKCNECHTVEYYHNNTDALSSIPTAEGIYYICSPPGFPVNLLE